MMAVTKRNTPASTAQNHLRFLGPALADKASRIILADSSAMSFVGGIVPHYATDFNQYQVTI